MSSSAQADDPVFAELDVFTGCPAFRLRAPRFGGL